MGLTSCQVLDDLVQGLQDAALGLKCDLGLGKQLEDVAAGERGDQLGSGNLMAHGFSETSPEPSRRPPGGDSFCARSPRARAPGGGRQGSLRPWLWPALGRDGRAAPDLGAVVWGRAGRGWLHLGGNGVSVSI